MTWKEKTCERCVFRVENKCRRFPPEQADYISVKWVSYIAGGESIYQAACAEYAELIEPPQTTEG